MQKARIFLILGVWVAILPYLGFPYSWKDILFTITGIALICLSYVLYKEIREKEGNQKTFDNFRENDNFDKTESSPGTSLN
ncbi:MAG: hypothetical protein WAV15_04105 [Minisyncoccia bacterium]